MKLPVRIEDVARVAGVSPKTVSRVVNGEAYVAQRTKEVVERAIESLGYRPNLAARSLAASRSFLIGLITPGVEDFHFFFHTLHTRSVRACRDRRLHLILEEVIDQSRSAMEMLESSLRQMRFDGVILAPPVSNYKKVLDVLDRLGIRYVRILPTLESGRSDSVCVDFAQGTTLLAEHFLALGHHRIAIAHLNRGPNLLREALLRLGADAADIHSQDLDWRKTPVQAGREIAATVLALRRRPTAIFSFNDEIAAGVVGYAWEQGLSVPRDLSVAGFDDGDVAQAIWPPLTTVRQPMDYIAQAAVRLLVEPAPDGKVREITCPVELIVRGSTGPVSKSR